MENIKCRNIYSKGIIIDGLDEKRLSKMSNILDIR